MMKTEVRIPGAFLEDVRKIILKFFQIILLKKIQVEKKRLFLFFGLLERSRSELAEENPR